MTKGNANPMNNIKAAHAAPRCRAASKRTGQRCKGPAVRGWAVCRFHGAGGGGPRGKRNGMYKHGLYTVEAIEERRALSALLRASRESLDALSSE